MPSFLDPQFAGEVPFERCIDEANNRWTPLTYQDAGESQPRDTTPAVVALDKATFAAGKGPRYHQGGTVFLPRGIDRRHGDRFTYGDVKYLLVGAARGDQDHPLTGENFGWVAFSFEKG